MKCDELKEYKAYEYGTSYVYDIGEVKEAIAELKARIQLDDDEMEGFLDLEEECGGGDLRNYIAELKQKLEDAKATHYAEMVDAGMRERRLRRALYNACANWAKCEERINNRDAYDASEYLPSAEDKFRKKAERWSEMERKCRAKAEQYK
jgi:hypothetical protein